MKTAFRDIRDALRDRIVSRQWPPGELVPNEADLAREFDCARATVNRAMRELAEEGLIERRRKSGTRVRASPRRQASFEVPVVRREVEATGARYAYALRDRSVEAAPTWLRARLGLAENTRVLHITCLHYAESHPYQREDRWINLAALPQAEMADFTRSGPNEWLLATVPYTDAEISFSAQGANADMARDLGCAVGDALFVAERMTAFQGQPVTYVQLVHQRGHQVRMRY